MTTGNSWITLGAIMMAIAVGLGAFGAHGLESYLPTRFDDAEKRLENWNTAVKYHMIHAVGIICIGTLAGRPVSRSLTFACWMLTIGIILFSGSLYGWVLLDSRPLVMIVPLGGLSFIVGWVLMAIGVTNRNLEQHA